MPILAKICPGGTLDGDTAEDVVDKAQKHGQNARGKEVNREQKRLEHLDRLNLWQQILIDGAPSLGTSWSAYSSRRLNWLSPRGLTTRTQRQFGHPREMLSLAWARRTAYA